MQNTQHAASGADVISSFGAAFDSSRVWAPTKTRDSSGALRRRFLRVTGHGGHQAPAIAVLRGTVSRWRHRRRCAWSCRRSLVQQAKYIVGLGCRRVAGASRVLHATYNALEARVLRPLALGTVLVIWPSALKPVQLTGRALLGGSGWCRSGISRRCAGCSRSSPAMSSWSRPQLAELQVDVDGGESRHRHA